MRSGHGRLGPQFKGFPQPSLPGNAPRSGLPLTHLATLPTGILFSLHANNVELTTLQQLTRLMVLFFPLSYPQTLPETRLITVPPIVTDTQVRIYKLDGRWIVYSPSQECLAAEIYCRLIKKSSPIQGPPGLPAALPLVSHVAVQEGFVSYSSRPTYRMRAKLLASGIW